MTKELKALDTIRNYLQALYMELDVKESISDDLDIIETAIERLQKLDETFKKYDLDDKWLEPALYVIKKHFPMNTETQLKKLKALDIIKEHKLLNYVLKNEKCANMYHLSEEEKESLKEALL